MTSRQERIDEAINGDYTPGPWKRSQSVSNRIDGPPDGYAGPNTVAIVSNPVNHDEDANANLVAAAPDLASAYREECAEVEKLKKDLVNERKLAGTLYYKIWEEVNQLREALDQIEHESSAEAMRAIAHDILDETEGKTHTILDEIPNKTEGKNG